MAEWSGSRCASARPPPSEAESAAVSDVSRSCAATHAPSLRIRASSRESIALLQPIPPLSPQSGVRIGRECFDGPQRMTLARLAVAPGVVGRIWREQPSMSLVLDEAGLKLMGPVACDVPSGLPSSPTRISPLQKKIREVRGITALFLPFRDEKGVRGSVGDPVEIRLDTDSDPAVVYPCSRSAALFARVAAPETQTFAVWQIPLTL